MINQHESTLKPLLKKVEIRLRSLRTQREWTLGELALLYLPVIYD